MSLASDDCQAKEDRRHMAAALNLALRGLGRVRPNPAVGCVLVQPCLDGGPGRVVGRGFTQPGGRPHAETQALKHAGPHAEGATAYVTLEPCSHHGKTPPCVDALLDAGIARCVVACRDSDPRVSGRGIERLREGCVAVTEGVLAEEAIRLNQGFFTRLSENRPMVTLKAATSLDGRIATRSGESRWITGEAARARGHLLRADHDAILIGTNTAVSDDPSLTCRLPGLEDRSPIRVVLDGRLRLSPTSKLVTTANLHPTWLICLERAAPDKVAALEKAGVEVIKVAEDPDGHPDLMSALQALAGRGITRLLVEGGGILAAALLGHEVVDRLVWFRAPMVLGGDGIPVAREFGVDTLGLAALFTRFQRIDAGQDSVEYFYRRL